MGQAVVHFDVVDKDGEKLQRYYAELFGWNVTADNPMHYGMDMVEPGQFKDPEGNAIGLVTDQQLEG